MTYIQRWALCTIAASTGAFAWELSGKVMDASGPVREAWVSITGPERMQPVMTDSQGSYSFQGKLPGSYWLEVQKDEVPAPPRRTVTLAPDAKLSHFDFRVIPGASISGRVIDERKQPVTGIGVEALLVFARRGGVRVSEAGGALTDDRGEYRIPRLAPGVYVVLARPMVQQVRKKTAAGAAGRKEYPQSTFYPSGNALDMASRIELGSGQERQGVDLVVEKVPSRCLRFTLNAAALQLTDAVSTSVTVRQWDGASGPTVAQGPAAPGVEQEICGLSPGEYRLSASAILRGRKLEGAGTAAVTAIVGKEDVDLGPVALEPPQDLHGAVTVKDAKLEERLPTGVSLRLGLRNRAWLPGDTLEAAVAPAGAFIFERLYEDAYDLEIDGLPDSYFLVEASQKSRSVREQGLRPSGGPLEIIVAADGAALHGRVSDESGQPAPDAAVFLIPRGRGEAKAVQSDQDGSYRLSAAPGEYRVIALTGLYDAERRDPEVALRFSTQAKELELRPHESRQADLRAQTGR